MEELKLAFEPHRFNKSQFKPIGAHIIVCDMDFDVRILSSGILLPNDDMKSAGIRPRWGKIYAVGSANTDPEYQIGKWIMISHGRWTRGVDLGGRRIIKKKRRVDPADILLISDEKLVDETWSDKVY
jgi:hypothetical protein